MTHENFCKQLLEIRLKEIKKDIEQIQDKDNQYINMNTNIDIENECDIERYRQIKEREIQRNKVCICGIKSTLESLAIINSKDLSYLYSIVNKDVVDRMWKEWSNKYNIEITPNREGYNKFHDDYIYNNLTLHKKNGIKEIIKRTYNSSLSDIENWLCAEKIYEYPFNDNKDDIITYLKSLIVPMNITNDGVSIIPNVGSNLDHAYCIIVDRKPYMWYCYKKSRCLDITSSLKLDTFNDNLEKLNYVEGSFYSSIEVGNINVSLTSVNPPYMSNGSGGKIKKIRQYIDLINNKYKNITIKNIKYILYKLNIDISDIEKIENEHHTKLFNYRGNYNYNQDNEFIREIHQLLISRLFKAFDNSNKCRLTEQFTDSLICSMLFGGDNTLSIARRDISSNFSRLNIV